MVTLGFKKSINFENVLMEIDTENFGKIDFKEFLHYMTQPLYIKDTKQDFRVIYESFKDPSTGFITAQSLRALADELGEDLDDF